MDQLSQLQFGWALAAASVGFFVIFGGICAGLPWLISAMELVGLMRRDARWAVTARHWTRILVVLLTGASITGTLLVVQAVVIWPRLVAVAMPAVGPALVTAILAVFVEAAFLTVYQLSWQRLSSRLHWLYSLPVVVAASITAISLGAIDAFAGSPAGLIVNDGAVVDANPMVALFNKTAALESAQVLTGCILLAAAAGTTYYALGWLVARARRNTHTGQVLGVLATTTLLMTLLVTASGPAWLHHLATSEPVKLAATQGLVHSEAGAPVVIGGHLDEDGLKGGLVIPGLLSWWAYRQPGAVIQGLDLTPSSLWPPLAVHEWFEWLLMAGLWLIAVVGTAAIWWSGRRREPANRLILWLLASSGPAAIVATLLAWLISLAGRLPYAITGVLLSQDAVYTSMPMLRASVLFPAIYLAVAGITVWVIWRLDCGKLRGTHG